jgi:hypothetical protein
MSRPPPQAYLLRLWREHQGAQWRATLVPVAAPEAQQHFADLDALHAFLRARISDEPDLHDDWDTSYCTPSEIS